MPTPEEIRRWRERMGLPPLPPEPRNPFEEYLGPVAVPTGTREPPPASDKEELLRRFLAAREAEAGAGGFGERRAVPLTEILGDIFRTVPAEVTGFLPGRTGREFRALQEEVGPLEAYRRPYEEGGAYFPSRKVPESVKSGIVAALRTRGIPDVIGQKIADVITPEQVGLKGALEIFAQPDVLTGPTVRAGALATRLGTRAAERAAPVVGRLATAGLEKAAPAARRLATEQRGFLRYPGGGPIPGESTLPNVFAEQKKAAAELQAALRSRGPNRTVRVKAAQEEVEALRELHINTLQGELPEAEWQRYQALQEELTRLEAELDVYVTGGTRTIVRPPRNAKMRLGFMSTDRLKALAEQEGVNPYKVDWWDSIDPVAVHDIQTTGMTRHARTPRDIRRQIALVKEDIQEVELGRTLPEAPVQTGGVAQPGMGIGERPAQGGLFENLRGEAERIPLADTEQMALRQQRAAEIAAGQGETPITKPAAVEAPGPAAAKPRIMAPEGPHEAITVSMSRTQAVQKQQAEWQRLQQNLRATSDPVERVSIQMEIEAVNDELRRLRAATEEIVSVQRYQQIGPERAAEIAREFQRAQATGGVRLSTKDLLRKGGYRPPLQSIADMEKTERQTAATMRGLATEFEGGNENLLARFSIDEIEERLAIELPRRPGSDIEDNQRAATFLREQADATERAIPVKAKRMEDFDLARQEEALAKAMEPAIREAPVGAETRPSVSETVGQIAQEPGIAPTGAPPSKPPGKPPAPPIEGMPPVEPIFPRPRTLADMNREAKGMRAMTPEQRAAVMDVAKPIEGSIMYQARPFNEHARNLLGADTDFNKALRGVPGVRQVFGAWNPAAMARDNPVAMIGLRQGIFQEIEKSRIRFVTLRWWHEAEPAFGFERSGTLYGLRPTSGVWKATKVKPAPGVKKGKMFGTINDMIEHPERYAPFTDEQVKVLHLANNTLTQSVRDAQRAGVNVVELAEAYWPRSVIKGPKGERGFAGVRGRISGAKGYTHQRVFADVDDLVKAGFDVETDPRRVLASRLEAGVDTISQANARKQIAALPGVEKPLERMARRFPKVLESAKQARIGRDAAKGVVVKAGAKATPEQVMAMRQAEADYITSMREVFAKKVEAGMPGYYELRLPSGRIAPQELVEEVGKFIDLPELRQAGTGVAARLTQEVSQALRATLTNVDLAAGYIQGQALFYRNNIAWWKAQGISVVSLIDDPTAWVAQNYDLIDEGVRAGAIVAPTEFLFAKQGIASIPLRIPYIGPALGSFNRGFEWFITAGQTELYRTARSGAFKNAGMDELVSLGSAIRKEVGTESYAILGVRPNQRTMEALILFAARFFRANVGLLGQSFTRGPGGAEARKAVGSLLAGGTSLLIGIEWVKNRKLPNMTDPYAPDWMQTRWGKTYFNPFGPFYPYFRTVARMSVALGEGDPMKAATEAKRFMASKESLPLRAIDIGGQLLYYGSAYVYGTKIEKTWASVAKGILSEFVTPISVQEIPSGFAEGRPEAVLEFSGLIGRPVRLASEKDKLLQPYWDIPANPQEVKDKAKEEGHPDKYVTREAYRGLNPEVDAILFLIGETSSFRTDYVSEPGAPESAFSIAVRLMKENGIGIEDVLPVKKYEPPSRTDLRARLATALGVKPPVLSPGFRWLWEKDVGPAKQPFEQYTDVQLWRMRGGAAPGAP